MTSIEWLIDQLPLIQQEGLRDVWEQAKEMHKIELGKTWDSALDKYEVRAGNYMRAYENFDDYYEETFVSKGSDDHIVDTNEMVEDTYKVWECCGMEECICKGSDDTPMERKLLKSGFVDVVPKQNDVMEVVEDDVEKLAIDKIIEMLESQIVLSAYNKLGGTQRTGDYRIGLRKAIDICSEVKDELPKSKSTLYTEEQVREVIRNCFKSNSIGFLITEDDMIRTIKQPKKD